MAVAIIYVKTYMNDVKSYALLFAALADVNRLRLLHLMREGEICVCFLQGTLQSNQPKISRHLAYLRRAGLAQATRRGKWMYYSLKPQSPEVERLLAQALALLAEEPVVRKDARRAKQIQCAPARFGLPDPKMDQGRPRAQPDHNGCGCGAE